MPLDEDELIPPLAEELEELFFAELELELATASDCELVLESDAVLSSEPELALDVSESELLEDELPLGI